MADVNAQLIAIAATPVNSIADVIAAFSAIDAALPESDGLKWFNWLYLTVTKAVDLSIGGGSGTYKPDLCTRSASRAAVPFG